MVAGACVLLYLFSVFGPNLLGVKHYHIQIVDSAVTVSIAFAVITATRRLTKRFSKTHAQFSGSISFFIIIFVSLITALSLLYQSNVNPQEILIASDAYFLDSSPYVVANNKNGFSNLCRMSCKHKSAR